MNFFTVSHPLHHHRQQDDHYHQDEEAELEQEEDYSKSRSLQEPSCSQGHRSSLILQTLEGGAICLLCFANLVSTPTSPTVHVSYALSQLSRALSHPPFLHSLLAFHAYFLVSPLVHALSAFNDDPIASQATDLILHLSTSGDSAFLGEFVLRVSERLSSGALAWSRRQVYTLHCLGVLLNCQTNNPYANIRDKEALVSNLVEGLQLPSEEIRGEILFVLYKLSVLQYMSQGVDGSDVLVAFCPKILYFSLEALLKTQSDDVRLNCVALLTVLVQKGLFRNALVNKANDMDSYKDENFMQATEDKIQKASLNMFIEAIKGSLLSSDSKVQIGTLDLIFYYLSLESTLEEQSQILVEENIADYVFEVLRLSERKDQVVYSCLQVLDLLSTAEQAFRQRLAIGFATLVPILDYVAEFPFHPVQQQMLKLIWNCISNCPGIVSTSHIEELCLVLTKIFRGHNNGEMSMHPDTFGMACSIFVALMKFPSSHGNSNLATSVQVASKDAVLACFSISNKYPCLLLHSLSLLKEAYAYCYEDNSNNSTSNAGLANCILDVCKRHLLPWLVTSINEMEEEIVLGIVETFHSILVQDSDIQAVEFAGILVSSSWFSLSFGCLGLFPTDKMKWRVYLMFSSIVDMLLGNDSGQPIRDAVSFLPSDPIDSLFLLGQKSSQNPELLLCQSAVLLILETSSLYDDRLADEKLILASLEQYLLVNSDSLCRDADSVALTRLVNLYGLYRHLAEIGYQISYSPEAERILFQIMVEKCWDLPSDRIHLASLKWLFQQEKIIKPLTDQILKVCRSNISRDNHISVHGKPSPNINVQRIAELVAMGDNFGATIFTCLLKQLVVEEDREHDIISVVNLMAVIINIFPAASDKLCLHGMGSAMQNLICHLSHFSSQHSRMAISLLVFNILRSLHPGTVYDDEGWVVVTMKLIDYLISKVAADGWTQEGLLGIGILCLVLHHSTNVSTSASLVEAAKTILLNTSLSCTIKNTIRVACSKGPALVDDNEGTSTGETLIFLLLLQYFSLRSLYAVLPEALDWQNFFNRSDSMQPLPLLGIHCDDLCRLIHFGCPLVKLISSYCLLKLFTGISEQGNGKLNEWNCDMKFLTSVMGILEGLVFCSDHRVALNCSLCLSMILGWEKLDMQETGVGGKTNWCRLIVEELAMSLLVPCLVSKSFMNHHKPAVHVAVALLKQEKYPEWVRSVFDYHCISGIIENLSASNMSPEIVLLFRELVKSQHLQADQIASLGQVLQACRKHMYTNSVEHENTQKLVEKVVSVSNDLVDVCEFLLCLMTSESCIQAGNNTLLGEIEMLLRNLADSENGHGNL
ncbi:protein PUTATIVE RECOMBINATION INITIATION DEFECT 1 [Malania oleifera]|uniref:protein PUTATIVE RECOMBINATION INITIATION DEFECT 1 n=1 Tax=Malania oleifera TaxID=397392 RepID=UPI0025AE8470|nr:protein PUTATIVE RECOMBINATION INITIATION DEFECT 1 [Malania oleifera]